MPSALSASARAIAASRSSSAMVMRARASSRICSSSAACAVVASVSRSCASRGPEPARPLRCSPSARPPRRPRRVTGRRPRPGARPRPARPRRSARCSAADRAASISPRPRQGRHRGHGAGQTLGGRRERAGHVPHLRSSSAAGTRAMVTGRLRSSASAVTPSRRSSWRRRNAVSALCGFAGQHVRLAAVPGLAPAASSAARGSFSQPGNSHDGGAGPRGHAGPRGLLSLALTRAYIISFH